MQRPRKSWAEQQLKVGKALREADLGLKALKGQIRPSLSKRGREMNQKNADSQKWQRQGHGTE